jgi:hypothetical protein
MDSPKITLARSRSLIMTTKPTQFNNLASGTSNFAPVRALNTEELNRLLNAGSLNRSDDKNLMNAQPAPGEKSEIVQLPLPEPDAT